MNDGLMLMDIARFSASVALFLLVVVVVVAVVVLLMLTDIACFSASVALFLLVMVVVVAVVVLLKLTDEVFPGVRPDTAETKAVGIGRICKHVPNGYSFSAFKLNRTDARKFCN